MYYLSVTQSLRILMYLVCVLFSVLVSNLQAATLNTECTVVINEFMPAKQRVLTDEDGDYEDWIELYNCSDEAIDLTGWYLSDRQDRPLQWQFPSVSIPAQGYLLVWASGKDRVDGKELHTNFRINAAGEPLLLSDAAAELIDETPPIEAHAHEVVGRSPDGVRELIARWWGSGEELEKPVVANALATNMEKYLALPWLGEYFSGLPVELSMEPRQDYEFGRWEGPSISAEQKYEVDMVLESAG